MLHRTSFEPDPMPAARHPSPLYRIGKFKIAGLNGFDE